MTAERLAGRVYVVTGADPLLGDVAAALAAAGGLVAVVSLDLAVPTVHTNVRTDPVDTIAWERVAPYVEQRLGPVDAVVTDRTSASTVQSVFGPDLHRRGHGTVVVVDAGSTTAGVVSALGDMP